VIEKSNVRRCLIGSTSTRTGPGTRTKLGCSLCPETFKRFKELLDANGIANELGGASVEDRCGWINPRVSGSSESDIIEV
jgi:hypothetical protein